MWIRLRYCWRVLRQGLPFVYCGPGATLDHCVIYGAGVHVDGGVCTNNLVDHAMHAIMIGALPKGYKFHI